MTFFLEIYFRLKFLPNNLHVPNYIKRSILKDVKLLQYRKNYKRRCLIFIFSKHNYAQMR